MGCFGSPLHGDAMGLVLPCKQPPLLCALPQGQQLPRLCPRDTEASGKESGLLGWVPPHLRACVTQSPSGLLARELLISPSGRPSLSADVILVLGGDKGSSRLSFCRLPCSDKAQHLLVLGGQDKFRCGGFRTSGDLFAAVALRRERAAWLVCPLHSWY